MMEHLKVMAKIKSESYKKQKIRRKLKRLNKATTAAKSPENKKLRSK